MNRPPRRPHRGLLLAVALVAGSAVGCGDLPGEGGKVERGATATPRTNPTGTDAPDTTDGTGDLDWQGCGDVECAGLPVPLDHDDPQGRTIDLALARHRASGDRIGALLVNPGGPGASGLALAEQAESYFTEALLERFDVVAWDPRGVGESAPVDCLDDLDPFWAVDRSPDDEAEVGENLDQARALVEGCEQRSDDLLPHVSSRATVRDMDLIRQALGEEQLTFLGYSYGTYIGALYAESYPQRVRALVLDGAVDPALSARDTTIEQAVGFESALTAFLDDCAADEECAFYSGGDPHGGYDRLMAQIDAEPLYARVGGEERELGPGEADLGVSAALYSGRAEWAYLAEALVEAARGDGSTLLQLSDAYSGRLPGGEYTDDLEAFYAIGCLDAPAPADADAFEEMAAEAEAGAPRFGAPSAWLGLPCAFWPVPPDGEPEPLTAAGAAPILVVGTANDPATPLVWAERLADGLESGVLAVLDDEGHTAYGRGSDCLDGIVEEYLIDLVIPPDGTRCSP